MELKIDNYLVEIIQNATEEAVSRLFQEHREKFYYCTLITTGEALCPVLSAWSQEALEREVQGEPNREELLDYLKWSYADSPYFAYGEEFFEAVKRTFIERWRELSTAEERIAEIEVRLNSMEQAMRNLDKKGLFGSGLQRLNIVINVEVMPPDYTNTRRAIRLNPEEAISEWLIEIAEEE